MLIKFAAAHAMVVLLTAFMKLFIALSYKSKSTRALALPAWLVWSSFRATTVLSY